MAKLKENTKLKLINTAGELFAKQGFRHTTVREICDKAGVNIASINYHFGDKEALYKAVMSHIFNYIDRIIDPIDQSAEPIDQLYQFIRLKLSSFLSNDRPEWHKMLMNQGRVHRNQDICNQFLKVVKKSSNTLKNILHKLTGLPMDSPELIYTKFSIMGQIHVLLRPPAFTPPDWEYMQTDRLEDIVEHIFLFTTRALGIEDTRKKVSPNNNLQH